MLKLLQFFTTLLFVPAFVVSIYIIIYNTFNLNIKNNNFISTASLDLLSSYQQIYIYTTIILTLVSIIIINRKALILKKYLIIFFLFFSIIIFFLIFTNSSLVFFIMYECLLLLTAIIVYFNSPNIRAKKITIHFLFWTQLSSLLLWIAILLIYWKTGSFNFNNYYIYNIDSNIFFLIKFLLLVSFCIKLPVWPFSYWLIKTHVEANTSFSIFLSGVLIKTALIGLIKFNLFFVNNLNFLLVFFILSSLLITSFELFTQIDLKKLIAYTTIQEMSLFLIFINFIGPSNKHLLFYFIILHTITSFILFFVNDLIYIRFKTRKTKVFLGCALTTPKLNFILVVVWLFFTSLPFTLKFIIELVIILKILILPTYIIVVIVVALQFLTIIFFSNNFITYSFGSGVKSTYDLIYTEFILIGLSIFFLITLVF